MKDPKTKLYKINFHGEVFFYAENPEDAVDRFKCQAETVSEKFVIDRVEEVKK